MSSELKLLIVGGSGFVGTSLSLAMRDKFQIYSTYHTQFTKIAGVKHIPVPNLNDKLSCDHFINSIDPQVVIYCMGSEKEPIDSDKENKKTQIVHSTATNHIMYASDIKKAKFIYLSSSSIFSGIEGNFAENDTPLPYTQLGKSKASAESFIKNRSMNHVIIRSAPLMGRGTLDHPSWLDLIRENAVKNIKIPLASKIIQNPVHISSLLKTIEMVIARDIKNKFLHVGGLTKISMYELSKLFLKEIKLNPDLIEASDAESSKAGSDYSLNFTETLKLIETEPLLLQQSFNLL